MEFFRSTQVTLTIHEQLFSDVININNFESSKHLEWNYFIEKSINSSEKMHYSRIFIVSATGIFFK